MTTRLETAKLASVFPATKEVVTRDSKDRLTTWNVRDPKNLENVKSGDRLQFTYTSSLAVSVTPAPPSTAPAAPGAAPATAPAATPAPMSP